MLFIQLLTLAVSMMIFISGIAFDYELPFHGLVPSDPSFEDMKRIVVVERRQPAIPEQWHADVVRTHYNHNIKSSDCVRAHMRACACACVRVCVRACVRTCACGLLSFTWWGMLPRG